MELFPVKCARCPNEGQVGKTILFKEVGTVAGGMKRYEGLCPDCAKADQLEHTEREPGCDYDKEGVD